MIVSEGTRTLEDLQRSVQDHTTALVEQWKLMHEILGALPIGLVRIDPGWNVDYVNPAAERILGRARNELAGPLYRNPLLAPFFEALKQASDEGRWGYPQPANLEREGRTLPIQFRIILLRASGDIFQGAMVLIDETPRVDFARRES